MKPFTPSTFGAPRAVAPPRPRAHAPRYRPCASERAPNCTRGRSLGAGLHTRWAAGRVGGRVGGRGLLERLALGLGDGSPEEERREGHQLPPPGGVSPRGARGGARAATRGGADRRVGEERGGGAEARLEDREEGGDGDVGGVVDAHEHGHGLPTGARRKQLGGEHVGQRPKGDGEQRGVERGGDRRGEPGLRGRARARRGRERSRECGEREGERGRDAEQHAAATERVDVQLGGGGPGA